MIGGALAVVITLSLATLVVPLTVDAQQAVKVPRIDILHASTAAPASQNL